MTKKTYKQIKQELDEVLAKLQNPDLDIDEALQLYEKGNKLVLELEKYLESAKLKITQATTNQKQ